MIDLKNLYDQCPKVKCPKGCIDCCTVVYITKEEADNLNLKQLHTGFNIKTLKCSLATHNECSQYKNRPFICRLFGTASSGPMSCNKTESINFISNQKAAELLTMYMQNIDFENIEDIDVIDKISHEHDEKVLSLGKIKPRDEHNCLQNKKEFFSTMEKIVVKQIHQKKLII